MTNASTQSLTRLITTTLGLRVNEQEQTALWQKILWRLKAIGFSSPEGYYHCLVSGDKAIAAAEWQALIQLVTVPESYFFRDQGQFSLLRNYVIPELLKRKSLNTEGSRTLRIWSAGCSTGEEVYSLAILVNELIPEAHAWNIIIVGTDINQASLEQANSGIYPQWSFRSIDSTLWKRYFRQHQQDWKIDPTLRSKVTFQLGNLVQDDYPSFNSGMYDFDLILCRNVFIYFEAQAIAHVLNKFYNTLAPQGYLLTGHTELHGQNTNQFQVKTFPESTLYQRCVKTTAINPDPIRSVYLNTDVTAKPQPNFNSSSNPSATLDLCEEISALIDRKA